MVLSCTRALGGLIDTRQRLGTRPRLPRSRRAEVHTPARLLHMPRLPTSSILHVNTHHQRSRWILRTEATSGEDPSAAESPIQPKQQSASAAQPVTDAANNASQQSAANAGEAQGPSTSAGQAEGAAAQAAAGQDQPSSSGSSTEPAASPAGPTAGKRLKQYADTYHQQGKQPQQQAATSSSTADAASAATTTIPEAPAAPLDNGVPEAASSSADASTSESKPFSLWDWGWLSWRPARAGKIAGQVALFVTIGIGYCAGLILWARGGPLRQDRPYTFVAVFDDVCGVYKGTPLRMKGVQIGQASSLATDLTTAEVTIQVNEESLIIPAGSHVEINHSGLFGDTFLDVALPEGDKAPGHVLLHKHAPGDPGCRGEGVLVCQGAKLEGRQGGNMDEMMRNMLKRNGPARPWVQ